MKTSINNIRATSNSYLFTGNYNDSIAFGIDTIISLTDEADIHLISTDIDGNISWINRIRGARGEYSQSLVEENEGNKYISGSFSKSLSSSPGLAKSYSSKSVAGKKTG